MNVRSGLSLSVILLVGSGWSVDRAGACDAESHRAVRAGAEDRAKAVEQPRSGPRGAVVGPWEFPRSLDGVSWYNSDCRPTMDAAGTRILFEANAVVGPPYDPENQTDSKFYIYQMDWDGEAWANRRGLDKERFGRHSLPSLSADGQHLYTASQGKIWRSEWNGSDWDDPEELTGPINDRLGTLGVGRASVTEDEGEIYFASTRTGSVGGSDLWVCTLAGLETDSLTNLGSAVNSTGSEVRPAISPDGQTLLFSDFAGGRPGLDYGETDLYISTFSGGRWSLAVPVDAPVNNDEPACTAHWVSDTEVLMGGGVCLGGQGAEDIWVTSVGGSGAEANRSVRAEDPAPRRYKAGVKTQWRAGASRRASGGVSGLRPPGRWERVQTLSDALIVEDLIQLSSGVLLAGTSDAGYVFRSEDEGANWDRVRLSPKEDEFRVYRLLELSNGEIMAGTYPAGLIYFSRDEGRTWRVRGRLPRWVTAARGLEELDSGDLLVGVSPDTVQDSPRGDSEGRVFRSSDNGFSWSLSGGLFKIASGVFSIYQTNDGEVWASGRSYGGKLYRSQDDGRSWDTIEPVYPSHVTLGAITCLFEDSRGQFWASGWAHGEGLGAIIISQQTPTDWEVLAPFQREVDGEDFHDDFVFDVAENHFGWLMVGTQPIMGSPAWISIDGGSTWNPTEAMDGAREAPAVLALENGDFLAGTTGDGAIWRWSRNVISAAMAGR